MVWAIDKVALNVTDLSSLPNRFEYLKRSFRLFNCNPAQSCSDVEEIIVADISPSLKPALDELRMSFASASPIPVRNERADGIDNDDISSNVAWA